VQMARADGIRWSEADRLGADFRTVANISYI
jgi:hypothetical protein